MKALLTSFTLLSFLLFSNSESDIASFNISLKRTGDVVEMKCTEGCAWKKLKFNLNKRTPKTVSSMGVFANDSASENVKSDFSFTVELAEDGFKFTSKNGTAWKELKYGIKPTKTMYLDEHGISSKNRH